MMSAPHEIISDEEIIRVHGHANFGDMSPREVVNDGVRKYAIGYTGGHTQLCILMEHGLITTPKPGKYSANLTQKGKRYARAVSATRTDLSQAAVAAALEAAAAILQKLWDDGDVLVDAENAATAIRAMITQPHHDALSAHVAAEVAKARAEDMAKIKAMTDALVEQNELLRSTMSIAGRGIIEGGASTNWDAFYNQLAVSMKKHHATVNFAREQIGDTNDRDA